MENDIVVQESDGRNTPYDINEVKGEVYDIYLLSSTTSGEKETVGECTIVHSFFKGKNIHELYNFEIYKPYRNMGYATKFMKYLTATYDNLWLGLRFDNPHWDQVLKLYSDNGFIVDKISCITPRNVYVNFYFLSMIHSVKNSNTISLANDIRNYFLTFVDPILIPFNLELNKHMCNIIREKLNLEREIGGSFDYKQDQFNVEINGFNSVSGEEANVYIPKSRYNFHTHPEICYNKSGCHSGWPSSDDMNVILSTYDIHMHFVFTKEGIYSIQISPEIIPFIFNEDPIFIKKFYQTLKDVFLHLEKFRMLSHADYSQRNIINLFLTFCNNLRILDLTSINEVLFKSFEFDTITSKNEPIGEYKMNILDSDDIKPEFRYLRIFNTNFYSYNNIREISSFEICFIGNWSNDVTVELDGHYLSISLGKINELVHLSNISGVKVHMKSGYLLYNPDDTLTVKYNNYKVTVNRI